MVQHQLRQLGLDTTHMQLDPQLPQVNTSFHLSSYKHPELIKRFDRFLLEDAAQLSLLRQQFNLP